ncbi:MAG TPA: nuclear transport factor 2 family protein [Candidatus Bathyarchaeia archaeon]|nr:nuclear transport factor 2 family protein [Candidatus Bathyarchaeia archaeon]
MRFVLLYNFLAVAMYAPLALTQSAQSPDIERVIQFTRERKQALERGDVVAWGAHVAEKCSFVEAGGRLSTKAQFSHFEPFVGYKFYIEDSDFRAADFGETIVLTYREKDIRDFGVQRAEETNIDMDTYTRLNGDWQLVSFSENSLPSDPPVAKLDPRLYDKYVGTYESTQKQLSLSHAKAINCLGNTRKTTNSSCCPPANRVSSVAETVLSTYSFGTDQDTSSDMNTTPKECILSTKRDRSL